MYTYVHSASGDGWVRVLPDLFSNVSAAWLGSAMALNNDGSTLAVSTYNDPFFLGTVFIYTAPPGTGLWTLQQKITAYDAGFRGTRAEFGWSVALSASGDTLACGAPSAPPPGGTTSVGAVVVFVRNGGVWTNQTGLIMPDSPTGSVGQQVALSASGDYLAFGAPNDDSDGTNNGAVYTMTRLGTVWSQPSRLRVLDSVMSGYRGLGRALSMSAAGTLVVSIYTESPWGAWWSEKQQDARNTRAKQVTRIDGMCALIILSVFCGPFIFVNQAF
jgi:hypothetical protein